LKVHRACGSLFSRPSLSLAAMASGLAFPCWPLSFSWRHSCSGFGNGLCLSVSSSSQSIASQCCVKKQGTGIKYPILLPIVVLGNKLHALGFFVLAETGASSSSSSSSPSLYYNVVSSPKILPRHYFSIDRTYRKEEVRREGSLPLLSVVILYRATRESREYLRLLVHASLLQNSITVPVHMSQFRLNETRSVYRSSGSIIHTQGGRCSQG
jgi:hypothetical protein